MTSSSAAARASAASAGPAAQRLAHSGALTPRAIESPAAPWKRFGFAFGRRFFVLAAIGLVWVAPAFRDVRFILGMVLWDAMLLAAWAVDLVRLPRPGQLLCRRQWSAPLALTIEQTVEITVENVSGKAAAVAITDDLPVSLCPEPPQITLGTDARENAGSYTVRPSLRGDAQCGFLYLRISSAMGLAERWARADLREQVRVYPNLREAERNTIYMARSRQIDLEKRFLRLRGEGREFDNLREYQEGDDLRDVCWTASARRRKPITRVYRIERNQPVWLILDCGRLMRTRVGEISKLDCAVNAALSLAQVAMFSGDRVGLLAYGRSVRALTPPGSGSPHLRRMIEQLATICTEVPEADHLRAASALLSRQRRRALVIWLTDLAETAMQPEVVQGAMSLTPPHLLLLMAISQPDVRLRAASAPEDREGMFEIAAAQELTNRRERLLGTVRERGALALEVDWRVLTATVINQYLNVKERGWL